MKEKREGAESIVEHSTKVFASEETAKSTILLEIIHEATEPGTIVKVDIFRSRVALPGLQLTEIIHQSLH